MKVEFFFFRRLQANKMEGEKPIRVFFFLTACLDAGSAADDAPATIVSIEREQGFPDAAAAASDARAEAGRRRATAAARGGRARADDESNASPLLPPPP